MRGWAGRRSEGRNTTPTPSREKERERPQQASKRVGHRLQVERLILKEFADVEAKAAFVANGMFLNLV